MLLQQTLSSTIVLKGQELLQFMFLQQILSSNTFVLPCHGQVLTSRLGAMFVILRDNHHCPVHGVDLHEC